MGRFEHLEMDDFDRSNPYINDVDDGLRDQFYYTQKADEAFINGDFEQALSMYSRALQYESNFEEAWLGQLRCLIELNELPEAITWSRKAQERFPNSADILSARCQAELRNGNVDVAIALSDALFKLKGISPYCWLTRGEILIKKNPINSKACFSKAIELAKSNDWTIHYHIAKLYMRNNMWSLALSELREAQKIEPRSFVVWFDMAECYKAMKYYKDATDAYKEALAINPSSIKAQTAHSELEKKNKSFTDKIKEYLNSKFL